PIGRLLALAFEVGAGRLLSVPHLGLVVRVLGVLVVFGLHGLAVGVLALAMGGLALVHGGLLGRLALAVALVAVLGGFALAVLARLVVVGLVGGVGQVVAQGEVAQDRAGDLG